MYNGFTKEVSQILIILMEILSQPCDLFAFRPWIRSRIFPSLILMVLIEKGGVAPSVGNVLEVGTTVHCFAKKVLKSVALSVGSVIKVSLSKWVGYLKILMCP